MKAPFFALLLFPLSASAGKIFYVGDSHSYITTMSPPKGERALGHVLLSGLEARGDTVSYYAACGADPGMWATGGNTTCGYSRYVRGKLTSKVSADFPSIAGIYSSAKFSALIVNLGDNQLSWKKVKWRLESGFDGADFQRQMKNFFAKLGKPVDCTWIGPTYHEEGETFRKLNSSVDELYKGLATFLAGKCRLIDSRPMVATSSSGDGLHLEAEESAKWGQKILESLK